MVFAFVVLWVLDRLLGLMYWLGSCRCISANGPQPHIIAMPWCLMRPLCPLCPFCPFMLVICTLTNWERFFFIWVLLNVLMGLSFLTYFRWYFFVLSPIAMEVCLPKVLKTFFSIILCGNTEQLKLYLCYFLLIIGLGIPCAPFHVPPSLSLN